MTQFGATDLLKSLMAHFPRDYFPGMSGEMKNTLYDSFLKQFSDYEDADVAAALDDWIASKSSAPAINDLLKVLAGKIKCDTKKWFYTMSPAEIELCRRICKNGFTEDGTHYEGPGVSSAYQDYTVEGSRDRIGVPFMDFFDFLKEQIKTGYLV